jgi:pyruvate formate lyase activating enzyme
MIFGGLQKNSLIDYPGKISSVLFFSGCNFRCPYCHNPELALNKPDKSQSIDHEQVYDFLEIQKGFLDGVVISGGEPTLSSELFSVCQKIREFGYPIKLDTNGTRPDIINRLIRENLINYIAMDIKTDPLYYSPLITKNFNPHNIFSSIRIIMQSNLDYEFRTTCVKPFINSEIIKKIAKFIKNANLYVLQEFRHNRVLNPEFFSDNSHEFSANQLLSFKSTAEMFVKKCLLRPV